MKSEYPGLSEKCFNIGNCYLRNFIVKMTGNNISKQEGVKTYTLPFEYTTVAGDFLQCFEKMSEPEKTDYSAVLYYSMEFSKSICQNVRTGNLNGRKTKPLSKNFCYRLKV